VSSVFVPKFLEVQRHGQNLPDLQSEWSDLGNTEHIAAIHLDGRGGTFPNCLTIISKHRCDYTQSCVFKPGSAVYLFFGTYLLGVLLTSFHTVSIIDCDMVSITTDIMMFALTTF